MSRAERTTARRLPCGASRLRSLERLRRRLLQLRREHDAIVQYPLRIGLPASAERSVGPKIAMDDGDLLKMTASTTEVLDDLASSPGGLVCTLLRGALASNDLDQFAFRNLRKNLPVE